MVTAMMPAAAAVLVTAVMSPATCCGRRSPESQILASHLQEAGHNQRSIADARAGNLDAIPYARHQTLILKKACRAQAHLSSGRVTLQPNMEVIIG
jgi:hypothetical protein